MINKAEQVICLQSFLLSDSSVFNALERARRRGVKVFILTSLKFLKEGVYETDDHWGRESYSGFLQEKCRGKFLLRTNDGFHGKYVIVDPLSENAMGMLLTCNITEKAMKDNLEMGVVLTLEQTRSLFQIFKYFFWEKSRHEQNATDVFTRTKPLGRIGIKSLKNSHVVYTITEEKSNLKNELIEAIRKAENRVFISTYSIDSGHQLIQEILRKKQSNPNLEVLLFCQNRIKNHKELAKLADAGIDILCHHKLHAKFLLVDENIGFVFTANFTKLGMDEGYEVGVRLTEKQFKDFYRIVEHWKKYVPLRLISKIAVVDLEKPFYTLGKDGYKKYKPKKFGSMYSSELYRNIAPVRRIYQNTMNGFKTGLYKKQEIKCTIHLGFDGYQREYIELIEQVSDNISIKKWKKIDRYIDGEPQYLEMKGVMISSRPTLEELLSVPDKYDRLQFYHEPKKK